MQEIVCLVLVRESNGKQSAVYYASQVLKEAKLYYPPFEKLAFAVFILATKLRPYFESHTIEVRTDYPMWKILYRPELSRRLST